jgi:hypothetical protein
MVELCTAFVKLPTVLFRKREVLFLNPGPWNDYSDSGIFRSFFKTLQASLGTTVPQKRHLPLSATLFPVHSS